jgi:hypothetical protein
MMRIIGFALIAVGFTWIVDAQLGFRVEAAQFFYPFDMATRQFLGFPLLATGILLEWLKSRWSRMEMLHNL